MKPRPEDIRPLRGPTPTPADAKARVHVRFRMAPDGIARVGRLHYWPGRLSERAATVYVGRTRFAVDPSLIVVATDGV